MPTASCLTHPASVPAKRELSSILEAVMTCLFLPGLQILYMLLQNVAQEEAAAQSFYQTYFCDILQHIFSVVTDTSHTAGEFLRNSVMNCPVSSMQSENIDV